MERVKMKVGDIPKVRDELIKAQGGICPICKRSLRGTVKKNIVIDHDHKTGVVRAALHRRCNAIEGKVLKVLSTWGGASTRPAQRKLIGNLLDFWERQSTPQTKWVYYSHKTESEKRLAINRKRRRLAAKKRAGTK